MNSQAVAAGMDCCGWSDGTPLRLVSDTTTAPARGGDLPAEPVAAGEPGAAGMRWLWGLVAGEACH